MIDFQESNLPDASLVVENNWNGILILAEFNTWLQNVGDQLISFQLLNIMLEEQLA